MAEPTIADVHVDGPLSDYSQAFMQAEESFAHRRFAPIKGVAKRSDKYFKWDRSDFFRSEAQKRAPGTASAVRDYALSNATYYCDRYSIAFAVSEMIRAQADPGLDIERTAAEGLVLDLMIRAEKDMATAYLDTASVWGTDKTVTTQWNDPASDVFGDIAVGIKTVAKAIGRRPNTLLLGADVWYDGFLNNEDILARLPDNSPRLITRDFVGQAFELDKVLVAQAAEESAGEGVTSSVAFIGGKHAVLAYIDPNPGLNNPTGAITFAWTGLLGATPSGIRTKRIMLPEVDALPLIESDIAYDFKVTSDVAGYRFASVVA